MADTTAFEAPRLLIFHPAQLTRRETWEEGEVDGRRRRFPEPPGDNKPVDGSSILMKATNSVHSWQFLGQGRFNTNRIASYHISREFTGPVNRVLNLKEKG